MLTYANVLFDWDGCLAQTLEVWLKAFRQALAPFDLYPDERAIAEQFGVDGGAAALGVPESDREQFIAQLLHFVDEGLEEVTLYPGAAELVEALHDYTNGSLALVTSSPRKALRAVLERTEIAKFFAVVVASEDVVNRKPHPEALERALAELGVGISGSVMIGDSTKDLDAARNARIDSILVRFPEHESFHNFEELCLRSPNHICRSFDEVRRLVTGPTVSS